MEFIKYLLIGALIAFVVFALFSLFVGAGLKAAQKTKINASVPLDCKTAVMVHEQYIPSGEWFPTLVENQTSPGYLEYIDRLKHNGIPYFVIPVVYDFQKNSWEKDLTR